MSQIHAAEVFGVTRQAIAHWVEIFRAEGKHALKAHKRGRPVGGQLEPWQAAQIVRQISDHCPDQLKLPFYLWTREAVGQLIQRRFDIELSVWTVGRYLSRWGFTPQKPVRRAFEQDSEQVRRWLQEEYPTIRARAKHARAEIYWADEMGVRSDHTVGRSFSRRGRTPVVAGTGKRFGCNMLSAITNRGRLYFMVFKSRFVSAVFVQFLRRLQKQIRRPIFLIVDSHPVHRSAAVRREIESHRGHLQMFFLPGYSPELNPDEYLNQDVKSNAAGRQRPITQGQMMSNVRGYLRSTQKMPDVVQSYFRAKDVRYAAM